MAPVRRERSARLFISVPQSLHRRIQEVAALAYQRPGEFMKQAIARAVAEQAQQQREVSHGR